jgi:tripartite-type tricarboxylate transporter receptor subunit TctC
MSVKRCALVLICALPLFALPAHAQRYPVNTVRIVVPFPAGGVVDALARPLAEWLRRLWDQPVIIENKAGAGSVIGATMVAHSPADGYTLLLTSEATLANNPNYYAQLSYDPVKDFAPITSLVAVPTMLLAHPSLQADTLAELVALAKAAPGKLNYGSYGAGTAPHLMYSNFEALSGAHLTHIPYKGGGAMIPALLANEIQLGQGNGFYFEMVRAGRLKALAYARAERDPQMPDVPTLAEAGFPDIDPRQWFGLLAPAGTPRPIVTKIAAAVASVFSDPKFIEQYITTQSLVPQLSNSPEEFASFIQAERDYKARMMERTGILHSE